MLLHFTLCDINIIILQMDGYIDKRFKTNNKQYKKFIIFYIFTHTYIHCTYTYIQRIYFCKILYYLFKINFKLFIYIGKVIIHKIAIK